MGSILNVEAGKMDLDLHCKHTYVEASFNDTIRIRQQDFVAKSSVFRISVLLWERWTGFGIPCFSF